MKQAMPVGWLKEVEIWGMDGNGRFQAEVWG